MSAMRAKSRGTSVQGQQTAVADPIESALSPRMDREEVLDQVRALRTRVREVRERYRGGLPAERQSRDALLVSEDLRGQPQYHARRHSKRTAIRRLLLSLRGRRIDLVSLLSQRRKTGLPLWAVVDPRKEIGSSNGRHDADGTLSVGGSYNAVSGLPTRQTAAVPSGVPVLPDRVRQILTDPALEKYRSRARWMGVLYQPESWREVNPDPALVVEWTDRPGEYYALAVWGGDRAAIMEFVD